MDVQSSPYSSEDSTGDLGPDGPGGAVTEPLGHGEPPPLKPMTPSLLGRFFAVPLLIIGSIVGGAVLVVLAFGAPVSPEPRSIDSLLQTLTASSGSKSMGLLLPREKELWQTALELSLRLENKEHEANLTDGDLDSIAKRLGDMVRVDLEGVDRFIASGPERAHQQRAVRSRRLEFVIHALGRTDRPEAVEPLLAVLRHGREPYVTVAMQELGRLYGLSESRRAVEPIVELLRESQRPETLLVACTVLSVLANGDDQHVIDALASTRLKFEGEVAWSAALALARLGSAAGKTTLLDLLDRSFLESGARYQVTDASGGIRRYPLPPRRVDELLIAAIDAASNLDENQVWAMIEDLRSDPSPSVRGRAEAVAKTRA